MNSNQRVVVSLVTALRRESITVLPSSANFKQKCFGSLVRASRALIAWERGDRASTIERLDDLFAYFVSNFEDGSTPEECRKVLTQDSKGRLVVSEMTFPVLITKFILRKMRLDMSLVPSFTPWAMRYERAVLTA